MYIVMDRVIQFRLRMAACNYIYHPVSAAEGSASISTVPSSDPSGTSSPSSSSVTIDEDLTVIQIQVASKNP